jgi:hypothetical protein
VRRYEAHCEAAGRDSFPRELRLAGTYLVAFVRRAKQGLNGSVANVKSQLRPLQAKGLGWLTKADLSKSNRLVAEMKMEDHGDRWGAAAGHRADQAHAGSARHD